MSNIVAGIAAVVGYVVVGNVCAYAGAKLGEAATNGDEKMMTAAVGGAVGGIAGGVVGAVAGWKIAKAFMEE